jgi:acid phosphatase (class A)
MANLFKDFDAKLFMKRKPPSDNSFDTDQELKQLSKIPINKKFVEEKDDIEATFKKASDAAGVEYPSALVKKLINDSRGTILKLKKHFNRPRPSELAKRRNIKLDNVEAKSTKTPSYPSGHSTQGVLIGEVLADMYPKAAAKFRKAGKDISYSRNVARAHYKSDSKIGEELGKEMFKHYKANVSSSPA